MRDIDPPDVPVGVEVDRSEAQRRIRDAIRSVTERVPVGFDVDSSGLATRVRAAVAAAQRAAGRVQVELDLDTDRVSRMLTGFVSATGRAGAALTGLGVAAAASYAALGAGVSVIGALTSGLGNLAGAAALAPAGLTALVVGIGTLRVALSGFGDALKAIADDDLAKFNEAIAGLAPAAQETARAIRGLRPAWEELRLDVQQRMFEGLGQEISRLGSTYLPILRSAMSGIAASFNQATRDLTAFLLDAQTVRDVGAGFSDLRQVVSNLAAGFAPLVEAMVLVGLTGASVLADLTGGFGGAAERLRNMVQAARESGQLEEWIRGSISALAQFGRILGNIGEALAGVFNAARQSGGGLLDTLEDLTGRLATLVNSVEGQTALAEFFAGARAAAQALAPVAAGVVQALGVIGPVLREIGVAAAPVIELLVTNLIAGIQAAAPGIVAFAQGFLRVVEALTPLLPLLGQIVGVIGFELGVVLSALAPALEAVARAFAAMAPVLVPIAAAIAPVVAGLLTFTRVASGVSSAISAITGAWRLLSVAFATSPIGFVITLIAGLVAALIYAWNNSETFRDVVTSVFQAIGNVVGAVVEFITGIVSGLGDFFSGIWTSIRDTALTIWNEIWAFLTEVWQGIVDTVRPIWEGLASFFEGVWNVIVEIFRFVAGVILAIVFTVLNPIVDVIQAAWGPLSEFFSTVWNAILAVAQTVWNAISNVISTVMNVIFSVITSVWNAIVGFLTPIWNSILSVATSVWNSVSGVISSVMNAIWGVISSVWNTIAGFFSSVWNRIWGAVSDGANRVWSTLSDLFNRIKSVAGDAINWLVDAGRNIVTGLWNGIASMGQWLYSKIMGWIKSVVPGPILQFLGIRSPSTWARDVVGKMIPRGLAIGITAEDAVVRRASRRLAETVGSSLAESMDQVALPDVGDVMVGAIRQAEDAARRFNARLAFGDGAAVSVEVMAPPVTRDGSGQEAVVLLRELVGLLRAGAARRDVTIDLDVHAGGVEETAAGTAAELRRLSALGVFA